MPIGIELQGAHGAVIESLTDFNDVLHTTLPYYDDATFQLLNKIDWYGDTEFEATQIAVLLRELDRIVPKAADADQVTFLNRLQQILIRCEATPGCKVKFLGD